MPETIIVKEHLPPGAAAVLINQSHTYPDIYLPINSKELKLYELIDGSRNISAIIDDAKSSQDIELARTFFQKLWWYDQVVFDVSQAAIKSR